MQSQSKPQPFFFLCSFIKTNLKGASLNIIKREDLVEQIRVKKVDLERKEDSHRQHQAQMQLFQESKWEKNQTWCSDKDPDFKEMIYMDKSMIKGRITEEKQLDKLHNDLRNLDQESTADHIVQLYHHFIELISKKVISKEEILDFLNKNMNELPPQLRKEIDPWLSQPGFNEVAWMKNRI